MQHRDLFRLALPLLLVACAGAPLAEPAEVSLRIDGFLKSEGITWLGWPNRVEEALEGLPGIQDVRVNLADDRFDVRYDERAVEPSEMLERIRGMGFEPELVESSGGPTANPVERVAVDRLPADLRASFAEARRRGQLVLLDFTAPGWMLCAKMDAVTYPHAQVIAELEDWVFARVDVSQHRKVAAAFGVPAVPVAVAVEPGGTILGRVPSFVEPEAFADWLRALDGTSASDE